MYRAVDKKELNRAVEDERMKDVTLEDTLLYHVARWKQDYGFIMTGMNAVKYMVMGAIHPWISVRVCVLGWLMYA